MKKAVIVIVILICGFIGYQQYSQYSAIKKTYPLIKNISVRVEGSLNIELNDTKITYREILKTLESDIEEINKKIIEIETESIPAANKKVDLIIGYLREMQALLRSQASYNRQSLVAHKASDMSAAIVKRAISEDSMEVFKIFNKEAKRALSESEKELETAEAEKKNFIEQLAKFEKKTTAAAEYLPHEVLPSKDIILNTLSKFGYFNAKNI